MKQHILVISQYFYPEEFRINEMENTLEEHLDRIEELEEEIDELKNENSD